MLLSRATHAPLPNSVAEVTSHVPSRAARRGCVPWSLGPSVAKQMAGFACLEGAQAKVKEPELRDEEHSWGLLLCCARGASGSHPFPLLLVRTRPLILRIDEEASSARELHVLQGMEQAPSGEP